MWFRDEVRTPAWNTFSWLTVVASVTGIAAARLIGGDCAIDAGECPPHSRAIGPPIATVTLAAASPILVGVGCADAIPGDHLWLVAAVAACTIRAAITRIVGTTTGDVITIVAITAGTATRARAGHA